MILLYSSQIVLMGAEFTQVRANSNGSYCKLTGSANVRPSRPLSRSLHQPSHVLLLLNRPRADRL
jgi:hypothetical protein